MDTAVSGLHECAMQCIGPCSGWICDEDAYALSTATSSVSSSILSYPPPPDKSISKPRGTATRRLSPFTHPATRQMLQRARAHQAQAGDGGLLFIALATALTKAGVRLAREGVPLRAVLGALDDLVTATDRFCDAPGNPSVGSIRLSDPDAMRAVFGSILMPACPCLGPSEVAHLAGLVLQALVAPLPADIGVIRCVLAESTVGSSSLMQLDGEPPALASTLVPGLLLSPAGGLPVETALLALDHSQGSLRTLLFDCDLSPPEASALPYTPSDSSPEQQSAEHGCRLLESVQSAILSAETHLVLCQRTIHPHLRLGLARHGVLCLERLSRLHVSAAQRATGAVPISDLDPTLIRSAALGTASGLSVVTVGRRQMVHLGSRSQQVSTLLLRGIPTAVAEDLQAAVGRCRGAFLALTSDARVCAGAGAWEFLLAEWLRHGSLCGAAAGQSAPCSHGFQAAQASARSGNALQCPALEPDAAASCRPSNFQTDTRQCGWGIVQNRIDLLAASPYPATSGDQNPSSCPIWLGCCGVPSANNGQLPSLYTRLMFNEVAQTLDRICSRVVCGACDRFTTGAVAAALRRANELGLKALFGPHDSHASSRKLEVVECFGLPRWHASHAKGIAAPVPVLRCLRGSVADCSVADILAAKQATMSAAVEAACMALDIDCYLISPE
eukprot:gene636-49_t